MMAMTVLVALGAVAALALVARSLRVHGTRALRLAFAAVTLVVGGAAAISLARVRAEAPAPLDLRPITYERSGSCARCHLREYQSWRRTFHRTMTQEVSPAAVIGDFHDVTLMYLGHPARMLRRGDSFFMDLVDHLWEQRTAQQGRDPATVRDPPRRRYRVDRLVGSHELQVYLTRFDDGTYFTLPFEWNQRERRWVTSLGNYLQPPLGIPWLFANATTWNETCIFCHNTRPNPGSLAAASTHLGADLVGSSPLRYASRAEELGIACEACHGPGAAHEAANADPVRRYFLGGSERHDRTIVNPARLDKERSLEVCGRCHGKFKVRGEHYAGAIAGGDPHVPGQEPLAAHYAEPEVGSDDARRSAGYYWPDGSPRPTAMEYQGVRLSACYQRGEMTCLSCHSMHRADPTDQLRDTDDPATARLEDAGPCITCHPAYRDDGALRAHTHHAPGGEGSRCVNCHMPFATFGLMKTVRSHRIVSPDARVTADTRLPIGCNQCHVDKSIAWTARYLSDWYGALPLAALGDERDSLPLAAVDLLAGHALSRAIAAVTLGWRPSLEAAPGGPRVQLLLLALEDDYAAVRLNAWVSLRALPGFEGLPYDYLAEPVVRSAALARLRERASSSIASRERADDSQIAERVVQSLVARRDRTPLTIFE